MPGQGGWVASAVAQKAIKGTFWMLCSFGLAKIVGIVSNVVLARLLFPDDFGLFALAATVIGTVTALGDLGTGAAVVYEQQGNPAHTNSAFWISITTSVLQVAATIAIAQWIDVVYQQPLLGGMLMVLSATFIIRALGETHQMLLSRELKFTAKAALDLLLFASSAVTSTLAAFLGFGVWSLVIGMIAGITIPSALAWICMPWRPSMSISIDQARAIIHYGKSLLGMGVVTFLAENVDYLIIGRVLGAGPLGLYSQGFRLANYPETTVVWAVQKVAFPTFAKIRDNREVLHASFLKTTQYLALVSFPMLTLLLILAPDLVPTLYGSRWVGMILPLQILCILGMSRSVTAVSKDMLVAVGRPDISLKCNLVVLPTVIMGAAIGSQFGIVGVAVAMTASLSAGSWILMAVTIREIGLPSRMVAAALQPGLTCSIVLFTGLVFFQRFALELLPSDSLWNLVYSALAGCCLYTLGLLLFCRKSLVEARAMFLSFRRNQDDEASTLPVG